MTCKAANFGGFPLKRLKTESAHVGDTFDVQRAPHLSILTCGTKATTGHRDPISQVITRANKSSTLKHVLEDGLETCRQTRSSGAVVNHEESPRPLTLCWLKKKTPASPTYSKKTCQTSLTLTLSNSSSSARIHLDSRLNGRKRVSQEDCNILISSKRKKQDTNQSSEDAITCSQPQVLQPLICSLDQAIPLNDDQRDADIELGDGDVYDKQTNGFVPQCFEVFVQTGPTISAPALPETPFDEDSDDLQARLEKQRRYREGLEKGMRNFLNQTLSVSLSTSELPEPEVSGQGTLLRSEAGQVNVQSNDQVVPHSVRPVFQMTDESQLMLEAAQGFVVMIDKQLRILYVSENVQQHLGHEQINMLGQDIEDYLHPKDVCDFKDQMSSKPSRLEHGGGRMSRRMFYVGMKFCFQKAGSRHKETGYTFVQWNAKVQFKRKSDHVQVQHLVALCRPVRTDSILELRLEGNMFISRHDLSFHFIYCDPRIINLIGYEPTDLIGRTAYQFHCPRDVLICKQCHKLLILSGSSKSDYYRFLSRSGKWVWLCTHATIVYDTTKKPQYVVCKNYVISEKEAREKLTQECQDFSDMKCLGFSLETDLPHIEQSPDKSLSHLDQQEEDGEALVHQLLSSQPVDVSDNPYARPSKKRNVSRVVGMGVSFAPGGAKNATFDADFRKDVIGHQDLIVSSHIDKLSSIDMLTSFDQLLTSQTQLDDANTLSLDSYTLPSSEDLAISFNDMLESSQTLQSIEESPVMTSDGQPNCDQLISGTLDSLDVPSLDQTFTSSFSGYGEFQPDLIDLMDYTPNVTESSTVTPSLDLTPPSEVMDYTPTTVYIKTTTNTFYRQPPGSISVLPQTFFMKSASNDSLNFVSRRDPTKSQNLQSSSKLLSLLKSSDTIEMPAPKVSVTNIPETVAKAKSTVSILNDVFLSQEKKSQSVKGLTAPSAGYRQSTFGHTDKNVTVSSNSLHESCSDVLFPNTASEDVMSDSHSDPFLSQLTDSSLYTDIMDEDLCPKDLTDMPMLSLTCTTDDQMSEKHDSGTVTLSSIGTTFSSSSLKVLDSFLNIISPSSDPMVPLNDSQTIPDAEKCSIASQPDIPPQVIKMAPMGWLSNESSSDSDNQGRDSDSQGRPSLLRSLLDKEGEVIQGPLTYKDWVLEEALKKKNEFKRNRLSTRTSKHAANQRLRGSKCVRSTELPLPKSHASLFSKEMSQRKPTKELPLPPSAHRHKTPCSSQSSPTSSNEEMNLPDDLLDLAVEYCANLAPDQAEALLSDLNDTTSFEDNLYSLITSSPSQSKSLNTGGSKQISLLDSSPSQQSNNHLFSNASQPVSELAQSSKNLMGSTLGSSGHSVISVLSPPDGSVYKSSGKDTNKMSLLRAAVTSPDVDKLIEQIPFGNIINFQQPPTEKKTDEPDIFITKVNGLQKMSGDESSQVNSVFKVPCLNNVRSPGKTSPSKAFQNSPLCTSDHIDAILFDHFYTASIATPHSPSAFSSTSVESPGFVVQTRVQPESSAAPKVIFINRGTQGKAKSTPSSPRISPSGQCSPSSPRSTGASASDLSSTRPISVMIMKKENHRSRRSKSIGIQTDDEPGEVYPEFERSATDTILYPSVTRISPKMPFLPSPSPSDTTSLSTSPTMSELEKFLRGFSSPEESCFSGEEDSQRRRGTPFLQKLLTGELSKDNYQRIDQQMLERERRESISSGCSDYDMN